MYWYILYIRNYQKPQIFDCVVSCCCQSASVMLVLEKLVIEAS
jgi:hypothetical protein